MSEDRLYRIDIHDERAEAHPSNGLNYMKAPSRSSKKPRTSLSQTPMTPASPSRFHQGGIIPAKASCIAYYTYYILLRIIFRIILASCQLKPWRFPRGIWAFRPSKGQQRSTRSPASPQAGGDARCDGMVGSMLLIRRLNSATALRMDS